MDGGTSQSDVIEYLCEHLTRNGLPPKRISTHVSEVFLSGDSAYKLKRAVKFPFLDFTTLAAREQACRRELAINQRTAPTIYRAVRAVTMGEAGLELDGAGAPAEWLVEMRRFDEATLFDRLSAQQGGLRRAMVEKLADEIATFHASADIDKQRGGHAGIRSIAENNKSSFAALPPETFAVDKVDEIISRTLRLIDLSRVDLDARRAAGRVRHCHGDLHLRNICLVDGQPTLFDAIEFSDDFSHIDTLYDLAFLLMDLDARDLHRLSSFVLNRYFDVSDETIDAFSVLPIFLSMRAQIRAHVGAAIAAAQEGDEDRARERDRARAYLDLAGRYLAPPTPVVVAVGGLSGSGKSRLARELAPYVDGPGSVRVLRTDVIRKRLSGVHPNARLGAEGYSKVMTRNTYAALIDQSRQMLSRRQPVILDAVFARPEERTAVEKLASDLGVPFRGIWVDAPEDVRVQRVEARRNNVSDAGADVARQQSAYDIGGLGWMRIDSSGSKDATLAHALSCLRSQS